LGALPLAVHAIPWQLINLFTALDYGVGQTLALRVAATLPISVKRAKHLTFGCFLITTLLFGLLSVFVFFFRRQIYRIFTKEQNVVDGCEEIWWVACLTYFMYTVYSVLSGTLMGLGVQWIYAVATMVFVWTISFPVLVYLYSTKKGSLYDTWFIFWTQYAAINISLIIYLLSVNWDKIAAKAKCEEMAESREEIDNEDIVPASKDQVKLIKTIELN
jgi:Na+-driven multidrug efflux pump